MPELRRVFEQLAANQFLRTEPAPTGPGLTVRVGSFSYKRGAPEDPGGHGGGFVFDCRALPNPGRLPEYAGCSGLEPDVATWLQREGPTAPFFDHVLGLVAAQVETYLDRGFDSLQVLFGCTGGQHRSVYFADRLGTVLRERFPQGDVAVTHAEAVHWPATARRPCSEPDS